MDISEKVLGILKSTTIPLKSSEIAEKSGLSKTDVDKSIKSLTNSGIVISPKRCYYELKK